MADNLILNKLFTLAAFQRLIKEFNTSVYSTVINKYIDTSIIHTNAEAIAEIYNYMRKHYRNQYYYRNTILNKLLLGVHSINTTTALAEIPISTSKADFVLINGKAIVYEIKTELDSLGRLKSQINNYYKAFDHVCVVTCKDYAQILLDKLCDTKIGIYVLSNNEKIKHIKEPVKCDDMLDLSVIFTVLNKPEYEQILIDYYGELPIVSQVKYYSKCKELFLQIPEIEAYKLFLRELKKRNPVKNKPLFNNVPYELKSLIYFSRYRDSDYTNLENFLSSNIGCD